MRAPSRRNAADATAAAERILALWRRRMDRKRCAMLIGLCVLISVPGWALLRADDDIRLLVNRPAYLATQEARIRELTGFDNASQFFLVEGDSVEAVLQREEALRVRLQPLLGQALNGYRALSAFVPSTQRQEENRVLLQQALFADPHKLRHLLSEADLRDEVAARMLADFRNAPKALLPADWLAAPLAQPFKTLWLGRTTTGYASIVMPLGLRDASALAQLKGDGVTWVDKAGSVSSLFHEYRQGGALWLPASFALILLLLSLRYGMRKAAILLIPAAIGIALALAFFGYAHIPVTLFNLMALMLVVGVGVNYAIFLIEGGGRQPATWTGVLLSAGTILLSFGLLAFSAMPALSGFGLTLLIGIGVAVLLSPLVLTLTENKAGI